MSKETPPPVERIAREAGLDDTIEQTFPASDPPSSIPNPCQYELLDDAGLPREGESEPKGHPQANPGSRRARNGE